MRCVRVRAAAAIHPANEPIDSNAPTHKDARTTSQQLTLHDCFYERTKCVASSSAEIRRTCRGCTGGCGGGGLSRGALSGRRGVAAVAVAAGPGADDVVGAAAAAAAVGLVSCGLTCGDGAVADMPARTPPILLARDGVAALSVVRWPVGVLPRRCLRRLRTLLQPRRWWTLLLLLRGRRCRRCCSLARCGCRPDCNVVSCTGEARCDGGV